MTPRPSVIDPNQQIDVAKKLRDNLESIARLIRDAARLIPKDRPSARIMEEFSAQVVEASAAMLQKLGTEVQRLREASGHVYYGRMPIRNLWNGSDGIAQTWNAGNVTDIKFPDIREIENKLKKG